MVPADCNEAFTAGYWSLSPRQSEYVFPEADLQVPGIWRATAAAGLALDLVWAGYTNASLSLLTPCCAATCISQTQYPKRCDECQQELPGSAGVRSVIEYLSPELSSWADLYYDPLTAEVVAHELYAVFQAVWARDGQAYAAYLERSNQHLLELLTKIQQDETVDS